MPKSVHDTVLDTMLYKIATATSISVCNTIPTSQAQAATTYRLASTVATYGTVIDDPGAGLGRKLPVNTKSTIPVVASGDANHIALFDGSTLFYVTTCTTQALVSGNTVTIPLWEIQVQDPT